MTLLGDALLYLIIACSILGCLASIISRESQLGRAYVNGLYAIGHIFLAIAGIFASIPYIIACVEWLLAPLYHLANLEPSIAVNSILAVDMGGYQVAMQSAESLEGATMAIFVGFMAGATVVFSIPVGLRILPVGLHRDFALGVMLGFLGIPLGVLLSCLLLLLEPVLIREGVSTQGVGSYELSFTLGFLLWNCMPLALFSLLVSLGLYYAREAMIGAFRCFGFVVDTWCKVFVCLLVVEHFSGGVSLVFGGFPFDPVFADGVEHIRALEIAGWTGLVLSGTFVLCELLSMLLRRGGILSREGLLAVGLLACASNVLAGYPLLEKMDSRRRVQVVAFSVCGGFMLGDHLSFCANFQPSLIMPMLLGKLAGGVFALLLARCFLKEEQGRA